MWPQNIGHCTLIIVEEGCVGNLTLARYFLSL